MEQNYLNYYSLLEIEPMASNDEIEKAYKKQWKKYHPDKNAGNELAGKLFDMVTKAKEILLNSVTRLEYDYTTGVKQRPLPVPIIKYIPQPSSTPPIVKVAFTGLAIFGTVKLLENLFGGKKKK